MKSDRCSRQTSVICSISYLLYLHICYRLFGKLDIMLNACKEFPLKYVNCIVAKLNLADYVEYYIELQQE